MAQALVVTGYPFDIPSRSFFSYCVMAFHLARAHSPDTTSSHLSLLREDCFSDLLCSHHLTTWRPHHLTFLSSYDTVLSSCYDVMML